MRTVSTAFVALLSGLFASRAVAQCVASGFSDNCDTVLSSICFNSETYDTCVNQVGAACNTDFTDPLNNICSSGGLAGCISDIADNESGLGSTEGGVVVAWAATCLTFQQTNEVSSAYACWTSGGTGSNCYDGGSGGDGGSGDGSGGSSPTATGSSGPSSSGSSGGSGSGTGSSGTGSSGGSGSGSSGGSGTNHQAEPKNAAGHLTVPTEISALLLVAILAAQL